MWTSSQPWQLDTCLPGKTLELWDLSILLFVFYDYFRSFRDGQSHPTYPFITNASRVHRAIVNAAIQTVGRAKNILTQWFYFWSAITNVDGGIYVLICYCMVSMNFPISTQALRDSGSILAAIWNTWNMPS